MNHSNISKMGSYDVVEGSRLLRVRQTLSQLCHLLVLCPWISQFMLQEPKLRNWAMHISFAELV